MQVELRRAPKLQSNKSDETLDEENEKKKKQDNFATIGKIFILISIVSFIIVVVILFYFSTLANEPIDFTQLKDVKIEILFKPGTCTRKSRDGLTIDVHYTGKFENGKVFDSSLPRKKPLSFVLGQGRVIQGWERGLQDMCIGEKRNLIIPPSLAYGEEGTADGVIPPNSVLFFEVELMDINGFVDSQK